MRFNRLHIDFYAGSYGNFLSYVLNRFIFEVAETNFSPFTALGTSHLGHNIDGYSKNKIVFVSHYSFKGIENIDEWKKQQLIDDITEITPDSGVIRICVDDYYAVFYNGLYRAADIPIDFDELEIDTFKKLKSAKFTGLKKSIVEDLGEHKNYNRSDLRNMFYSSFIDNDLGIDQYNKFDNITSPIFNFPVSSIYDYNKFVEQLGQISVFAGKRGWTYKHEDLYAIWQEFIQRNQGYESYKKCQMIIENILSASNTDIKCNIIEEAYINSFITRAFNLYNGIACFDDNVYPTNTSDIHNLIINQVRKNRDL